MRTVTTASCSLRGEASAEHAQQLQLRRRLGPAVPQRPSPQRAPNARRARFGAPELTIESSGTRRVPDEWYVGFHRGLAARFWRAAGATMAEADLKVVLGLLPAAPARVLDVPCGDGRLTLPLAAAGYEMTGVDISQPEIEHARERGHGRARFEHGDLRALPDVGRFDAIVSWGNSFGYVTPVESQRSLASMQGGATTRRQADPRVDDGRRVVPGRRDRHACGVRVRRCADDGREPLPRAGEPLRERVHVRGRARARRAIPRRAPRPHHGRGRADAAHRRVRARRAAWA